MMLLTISAYDVVFEECLQKSADKAGVKVRFTDQPTPAETRDAMEVGVSWIAGDLVDPTWTMRVWRTPHWSEGAEMETMVVKQAADHVPGGPPVMREKARRALDRMMATVADLERTGRMIVAAGGLESVPPLWCFHANKVALALVAWGQFDLSNIRKDGYGSLRDPGSGRARDLPGNGRLIAWTRRFRLHVDSCVLSDRSVRYRKSHKRMRHVLSMEGGHMPETVLSTMAGRKLGDVVAHHAWPNGCDVRITSVARDPHAPVGETLSLALSDQCEPLEPIPERALTT